MKSKFWPTNADGPLGDRTLPAPGHSANSRCRSLPLFQSYTIFFLGTQGFPAFLPKMLEFSASDERSAVDYTGSKVTFKEVSPEITKSMPFW